MTQLGRILVILALSLCHVQCSKSASDKEILVITVATDETDGFLRFKRSLNTNKLKYKVLGLGEVWKGGNIAFEAGGGHKINLLKEELEKHKDDENKIIMFTDSYDVVITANEATILNKFDSLDAKVIFGAEDFCWPDKSLASKYPKVSFGYKYLNSGGIIGYASELYQIVSRTPIKDLEDDQLYYTNIFLDEKLRKKYSMKLDTQAKIFQNLNGQSGDAALKFEEDDTVVVNTVYNNNPAVIHGNGPSKILLNSLGSYLAKSWTATGGCFSCKENVIQDKTSFSILMSIMIEKPMPFLEEMLQKLVDLDYPKEKIHLLVHNQAKLHDDLVSSWVEEQKSNGYASITYKALKDNVKEWHARNLGIELCITKKCDALFNVDADVHLDNPYTLQHLVGYNRGVVAPMVLRVGTAWSNFWGAINNEGFYARSIDYMDIINTERRGIWNVPYMTGIYLIQRKVLENPDTRPSYIHRLMDADMAFSTNLRQKGVFMYLSNLEEFGHLIEPDYFPTEFLYNDMWQMKANRKDWEDRYILKDYWRALLPETQNPMPCPDVYWFPVFTPRFCKELIEISESYGDWSGGKNEDKRLAGGYENVPTDDIHMNQIEFEQEWLWILKEYIKPLAEKVYIGYTSDARAIMNFIVRYKPDKQSALKPHHDSSTYTINMGLNTPDVDYEGGGANFLRYNCSVQNTRVGWALMHPGRLTHYHEGLKTTKGTRYIMISFIDP